MRTGADSDILNEFLLKVERIREREREREREASFVPSGYGTWLRS